MKRTVFLGACSLGLLLLLLSGCQPAANTNQPVVVTSPSPERVDTASIQTEIMRIENDWPRIIKEKDAAAVERIEADDAIFIYPDGSLGNKAQDVKDISSGALMADLWQVADLQVTVLDADSAFATGRNIVTNGKYRLPNGKTINTPGQTRFIDTYSRRNGQWKIVAAASVPVTAPAAAASPAMTASPATSPTMKPSPTVKPSPAAKPSPATTHTPAVKASPATTP